ncbi:MAG: hypothetical protein L3J06_01920 [Cyclobacteriaceae bacterium]|nr:hypothetical protein [Cyclobacteriaceae bacterium]
MSVTSILKYENSAFKKYRDALAKYPIPKFDSEKYKIRAKPRTTNYPLIGTAFDYLLRFTIERNFKASVISSSWVAENTVNFFKKNNSINFENYNFHASKALLDKNKLFSKDISSRFKFVKDIFFYRYVYKKKPLDVDILKGCLFLAKLDYLYRTGYQNRDAVDFFSESDLDVSDLESLIEICPIEIFKPKKSIILNPTFGKASTMVGGADADIIVDDTLIDIKVTKEMKITRPYFNQLLTYYILSLMEKTEKRSTITIDKLSLYFARYGYSIRILVKGIASKESFLDLLEILKFDLSNSNPHTVSSQTN